MPEFYANPVEMLRGPLKTGDIIEVSMPLSFPASVVFGFNVFHYRVNLAINNYTIQQFADGVGQEVEQAISSSGLDALSSTAVIGTGAVWGPVHVRNLSQLNSEAGTERSFTFKNSGRGTVEALPLRSAALIRKHTASGGVTGQGRMLIAPISEPAQTAGVLAVPFRTALESYAADLANMTDIGGLAGVNATMVIYNQTASKRDSNVQVTPVVSVSCAHVLGSIRARTRVSPR